MPTKYTHTATIDQYLFLQLSIPYTLNFVNNSSISTSSS